METPKAREIMNEYLKTHKHSSYYGARSNRYYNNHLVLLEVAEEMKKRGFDCYCAEDYYRAESTSLIYAVKENECVLFGFGEVPYRWYVYSEHYPGLVRGLEGEHGYDFPFSIDEILSQVGPNRFKEEKFDSPFYVKL